MDYKNLLLAIKSLLDDSQLWYYPHVLSAMEEAHYRLIQQFYQQQNELFLRPYYRRDYDLNDGDLIQEVDWSGGDFTELSRISNDGVLYPRIVRIYFLPLFSMTPIDNYYITARYVEPNIYYQHIDINTYIYNNETQAFQLNTHKDVVYTVINNHIYYPQAHSYMKAEIYYIVRPKPIYDANINTVNLPLFDDIFIPNYVGLVAEILNTKDVMELGRGDIFNIYAGNKKLTLEGTLKMLEQQGG